MTNYKQGEVVEGAVAIFIPMTPPRECSPNARIHYRQRALMARMFREVSRWSALDAVSGDPGGLEGLLRAKRVAYSIAISWEVGRRGILDEDNIIASCKACLDGIADAIGVNDRVFTLRGVEVDRRKKTGSMVVTLWPLPRGS